MTHKSVYVVNSQEKHYYTYYCDYCLQQQKSKSDFSVMYCWFDKGKKADWSGDKCSLCQDPLYYWGVDIANSDTGKTITVPSKEAPEKYISVYRNPIGRDTYYI